MTSRDTPNGLQHGSSQAVARVPTIGLALGGGGARGFAHVAIIEALDELNVRPKIIAGTSIGAIIGAAYASGMSGREIRGHMVEILTGRFDLLRDLFSARARPKLAGLFGPMNALLAPEALLDVVYPSRVARDFAGLQTPIKIVSSDFYAQEQVVLTEGSLRRAVAASMALPALFEPVLLGGRALIDGGLTNPLPFDLLKGEVDIVIAIDVSGVPVPSPNRSYPSAMEALFASSFIFERTIIREKLKSQQPDIYLNAGTSHFQVAEFWKVQEILAAAEPAKQKLMAQLGRVLQSETVAEVGDNEAPALLTGPEEHRALDKPIRRRMLPRFKRRRRNRDDEAS
jgi:NTE family protein